MIVPSLRDGVILALLPSLLSAEVVFSRRVYDQRARTFQQIWTWNPSDGTLKRLTHSPKNHFQPACSTNGSDVRFLSGADLHDSDSAWTFNRKTGKERKISAAQQPSVPRSQPPASGCSDSAAWAPGKRRFACPSGQDVVIFDTSAKKELGRAPFTQRPTPPSAIAWSQNGKWLLVGTRGENDNSTSRQADYFALDLARMAWIPVGSGNDAMWLPSLNQIIYSTPRDLVSLAPSSNHRVWSSQLVVFDPATRRRTQVTSGVTNNIQPAPCAHRESRSR